ncbi:MAG: hypothetical protein IT326_00720 [Anaerolineae bacterium]|nr:hypothetical protein [Anaerolineae bacterium]
MHRFKSNLTILLAACAGFGGLLACNLPAPATEVAPPPPTLAPEQSSAALDSFNNKWREVSLTAPDSPFSVTFTESELSAAINAAIDEAEASGLSPVPINSASVALRDGAIYIYAGAALGIVEANGVVVATPSIGANGMVDIALQSAEFGAVELDETLLTEIETSIEESINTPLTTSPFPITLTGITIDQGSLTIGGQAGQ